MKAVELALEKILEEAFQRVSELAGESLANRIEVVWNSRMRSSAGRAMWPACRIELNPKLLQVDLKEVRRTLLHELAHLLAYHRAGGRPIAPHGVEWQRACADLGIPGESATHHLPLPTRTMRKRWRYHCPSCGASHERVHKIKGQQACYTCCKSYNKGKYHKKFRFQQEAIEHEDHSA